MKSFSGTAVAIVTALSALGASALTAPFCPDGSKQVCFRWGVPSTAANANSGNVYFRIEAPVANSWVGLGIGSSMRGSEIFLVYQDGNGNVTLSTRDGTGHVMPEHADRRGVELLDGSGVKDGKMVANIKCSSCNSLDRNGNNNWIAAWKQGDSIASTRTSEPIQIHDEHRSFQVNFAQASINSDRNPFTGSGAIDNKGNNNNNNNNTESGSGGAVSTGGKSNTDKLIEAHGIIMTIVFLAGYPIGSLLMPLVGKWYIHAAWQMLSFFGMWAAFGLGYVAAKRQGQWASPTHVKLGTIVVSLMAVQPILGWLQHRYFVKHQQRSMFGHGHIWYGRILMILGIINGGLGIKLAGGGKSWIIPYSVVAGLVFVAYVASAVLGCVRGGAKTNRLMSPQMSQEEQSSTAGSGIKHN